VPGNNDLPGMIIEKRRSNGGYAELHFAEISLSNRKNWK
jgi:hypothetical protein